MSAEDVQQVHAMRKRYKELLALREVALYTGDAAKAMRCRTEADAISREFYQKYDIII